ncbi:MAG TPA: hypothetical protein VF980_15420 [Thermoanaerobaculia bacterium]
MNVGRHGAIFAFFLALAIALTWPLAAELPTAVSDRGDPLLNAFILDWVAHALTHQPLRLFEAPIFFPFRYSLALSEHMTGIALLVLPFHLAGVSAVTLHNIAMLLSFALSGYGAFVLARMVTGDSIAALTAGVFYAFVSFKFDHLAHVQIIASGWIPLTLAALLRFWRSGSKRDAVLFAIAFTINGLSNIYWLDFTGFAVVATLVFLEASGHAFDRRRLALALIASAIVLLPFLIPYEIVSREYRMYRTSFEASRGSATLSDWLSAAPASLMYGWWGGGAQERHLFPGVLSLTLAIASFGTFAGLKEQTPHRSVRLFAAGAIVCAIIGIALLPRHRSDVPFMFAAILAMACLPLRRLRDPVPWVAVLWIAIGLIGSLGEHAFLQPFLFRVVEPFRAMRTPARWAIIVYCGLAILMAIGASRFRRFRYAILLLAIVEVIPRIRWDHVPATFPPVYTWLAHARPRAAIELPIGWNETEAEYVLATSVHRVPIMNGVSGFDTPVHAEMVRHEYDDAMIARLERYSVPVVIVHPPAAAGVERLVARDRLKQLARFNDGDAVYSVATAPPPSASPPSP